MCSVIINGENAPIRSDGLQKVAELVELIKNSIDPEHMITGILLDGRELEDSDWQAGLGQYETSILEIETGTPTEFVATRLGTAGAIVESCAREFQASRTCFQEGQMADGNKKLLQAVNTLQAFFEWYGTLMELISAEEKAHFNITSQVEAISGTCKKICQQQLYQSWWALGETISADLEPQLKELEEFCKSFSAEQSAA